jgi:hypothetical protein
MMFARQRGFIINPFVFAGGGSIALDITSNTTNYNIWDNRGGDYVAGSAVITVTIDSGVYVYSNSTGSVALDTGTGWSSGDQIIIVNNGYVMGMGGRGGYYGSSAQAGGNAMNLQWDVEIDNTSGYILGGGGGGGGAYVSGTDYAGGGGGAGGGAGGNSWLSGYAVRYGGAGGAVGASGGNGDYQSGSSFGVVAAGGGGRVYNGSGGAGGLGYYTGVARVGTGGGAGGGGGYAAGWVYSSGTEQAGDGGAYNAAGHNYVSSISQDYSDTVGGGGGGWGQSGGTGFGSYGYPPPSGVAIPPGSGGKAVNKNGYAITWDGGSSSPQVLGAVS